MRIWVVILLLSCAGSVMGQDVDKAIQALGASSFTARQLAVTNLVSLAETNHDEVLKETVKAYRGTSDPEVKAGLRAAMQQIVDKYIYWAPRGFLGVALNNVVVNNGGRIVINGASMPSNALWINGVVAGSAAETAGVQPNDFILSVDGQAGLKTEDFIDYVLSRPPKTHVQLVTVRGDATNQVDVTLGELPQEQREKKLSPEDEQRFFKKWLKQQGIGSSAALESTMAQ